MCCYDREQIWWRKLSQQPLSSDIVETEENSHELNGKDLIAIIETDTFEVSSDMKDVDMISTSPTYAPRASLQKTRSSLETPASRGSALHSTLASSRSVVSTVPCGEEFAIQLLRAPGESLGLDLDSLDGTGLLICAIKSGPVRTYNSFAPTKAMQLRSGDRIHEVNGVSGDGKAMLEKLKVDETLQMLIRRPTLFPVVIPRAYGPLGLQVEHTVTGINLLVKAVNHGLIRDFNELQTGQGLGAQIRRKDRICKVNGEKGNPLELLSKMKNAALQGEKLELEIARYDI